MKNKFVYKNYIDTFYFIWKIQELVKAIDIKLIHMYIGKNQS